MTISKELEQKLRDMAREKAQRLHVDDQVREFHRVMGQEVREAPSAPDEKVVRLRARLVAEECLEMLQAMFRVSDEQDRQVGGYSHLFDRISAELAVLIDNADLDVDLPALADALADIDYVVAGTRLAFGIDGRPIADLVHASNMAKANGPVREDGKRGKPEGWQPPDVASELRRQGWVDGRDGGTESEPAP